MNKWLNEWLNERMDEWMDEWMNKWMNDLHLAIDNWEFWRIWLSAPRHFREGNCSLYFSNWFVKISSKIGWLSRKLFSWCFACSCCVTWCKAWLMIGWWLSLWHLTAENNPNNTNNFIFFFFKLSYLKKRKNKYKKWVENKIL